MKPTFIFFFLSLATIQIGAQDAMENLLVDTTTIDTWLRESNVPGIALSKIENGKLQFTITRGSDLVGKNVDASTVFDVASLTKSITTLATMKLVEKGTWDLDEPLNQFWIDPDVKDDDRHHYLTTRHVLSHRSGFKNWRWMNEDKKLAFDFKPGEKFQYSGEGFEYLRRALEYKFKVSFERLAESLVFKPMQMSNSALVWNPKMEQRNFAGSHNKEGKPYEYEKAYKANAADNLLTTLDDFSRLALTLLNKRYLESSLFDEMVRSHSNVRKGIDFALGWIVFKDLSNGEYAMFNAGSDQGVNALIVLLPESKRGVVVMTNGDNGRQLAMKSIDLVLGDVGKEILSRL